MTEVVTNAAASLQPVLQANRLQAFGVDQPDPTASDQAANTAAIRSDVVLQAAQVSQPSGDRSSLQDNFGSAGSGGGNFSSTFGSASGQDSNQGAAPTTGPAKAVVTVQVAGAAGQTPPSPVEASVLNAAEDLNDQEMEMLAQDVIGTAFAPMQMLVSPGVGPRSATQKDIIFDGHKLFGDRMPQGLAPVITGTGVAAAETSTFAAATEAAASPGADGRSLYERAQAVADTLGAKAPTNPGVKQLFTELAAYGAVAGATPAPTVTRIA